MRTDAELTIPGNKAESQRGRFGKEEQRRERALTFEKKPEQDNRHFAFQKENRIEAQRSGFDSERSCDRMREK